MYLRRIYSLLDVKKGKLKMTYIESHHPCMLHIYIIYTYIHHTRGWWTLKTVILIRNLDKR